MTTLGAIGRGLLSGFADFAGDKVKRIDKESEEVLKRWEEREKQRVWKEREEIKHNYSLKRTKADADMRQKMGRADFLWEQEMTRFADLYGGDQNVALKNLKDSLSMVPSKQLLSKIVNDYLIKTRSGKEYDENDLKVIGTLDFRTQDVLHKGNHLLKEQNEKKRLEASKYKRYRENQDWIIERRIQDYDIKSRKTYEENKERARKPLKEYDDAMKELMGGKEGILSNTQALLTEVQEIWETIRKQKVIYMGKEDKIKDTNLSLVDEDGRMNKTLRKVILKLHPNLSNRYRVLDSQWTEYDAIDQKKKNYEEKLINTPTTLWNPPEPSIADVTPKEAEIQFRVANERQREQIEQLEASRKEPPTKGQTWTYEGKTYKIGSVYVFEGKKYRCTGVEQFKEIPKR